MNASRPSCRDNQEWRAFKRYCSSVCYAPAGWTCRSAFVRGYLCSQTVNLPSESAVINVSVSSLYWRRSRRVCKKWTHWPLLDQAADDTQRIVDGALCLLDHQLVGASNHDAHRLPGTGAAGDLHREHKTFTGSFTTVSGQPLDGEVCLLF